MKAFFTICCVIASVQMAVAQNKESQELHQLNKQFIQDFIHNDTVAHNEIIHPDNFLFIDSTGVLVNREGYMRKCANAFDSAMFRDFRYADENIRMFGNTAIVIAKTVCLVYKGSYWLEEETRYADTYIKERGRWWCVQAQLTKISL